MRRQVAQHCFKMPNHRNCNFLPIEQRINPCKLAARMQALARRAKHQTGRPTRAGPRTPPNVPRTSPGALPHGGPAEGRGLPQARVNHASVAARQSDADGRPNAGKEAQVVSKALSPGSPATQCVEHGSRVRMFAPVTRPNEGPVHNMRVHQFRPKRRVLGLFRFRMVSVQSLPDATACGEAMPTSSAVPWFIESAVVSTSAGREPRALRSVSIISIFEISI